MIEGNRKKIRVAIALNNPAIPEGELTIDAEPVVTVKASKIPAEAAEKNKEIIKNISK